MGTLAAILHEVRQAYAMNFHDGAASLHTWHEMFGELRRQLTVAGADEDDEQLFLDAIARAAREASALSDPDRAALHDALRSAFNGEPQQVFEPQVIRGNFLNQVRFDAGVW